MEHVTDHAVVLIVDIVRSTALYEELGNQVARERVGACLRALGEIVTAQEGQVIKSMGDGLLCRFAVPDNAVAAATAMCARVPQLSLEIRVGLHYGEIIIEDDGDIFGDAVNTASRVADIANPGEILITRDLQALLTPSRHLMTRAVQPVSVKGKRDPLELFAVVMNTPNETMVFSLTPALLSELRPAPELEITYRGRVFRLDATHSELTVGRGSECDVVVEEQWASRVHARIYRRTDRFFLADRSANGTFVAHESMSTLFVHREETLLVQAGLIYLGSDPATQPTEPIRYRLC
jgi:adenylate cyclase